MIETVKNSIKIVFAYRALKTFETEHYRVRSELWLEPARLYHLWTRNIPSFLPCHNAICQWPETEAHEDAPISQPVLFPNKTSNNETTLIN